MPPRLGVIAFPKPKTAVVQAMFLINFVAVFPRGVSFLLRVRQGCLTGMHPGKIPPEGLAEINANLLAARDLRSQNDSRANGETGKMSAKDALMDDSGMLQAPNRLQTT
jgi:hypothetical protein